VATEAGSQFMVCFARFDRLGLDRLGPTVAEGHSLWPCTPACAAALAVLSTRKAARGVPPNARAETMIPVSTTARSATSSGGHSPPPHLPHCRLDELLRGDRGRGRTTRHARVWCRAAVVVKPTDGAERASWGS
jgi:hypothetical protein